MARIKRVSIWDMDGTIVDSSHRYRTLKGADGVERIDLEHWRANQRLALHDKLLPLADEYKKDLQDTHCYVIIATARVMNAPDWQFVHEVLGKPHHFIHRKEGDSRSGGLLKVKGLKKFFNLKPFQGVDVVFYEDNAAYLKTVCDTFKIKGVYVPSIQGH